MHKSFTIVRTLGVFIVNRSLILFENFVMLTEKLTKISCNWRGYAAGLPQPLPPGGRGGDRPLCHVTHETIIITLIINNIKTMLSVKLYLKQKVLLLIYLLLQGDINVSRDVISKSIMFDM